MAQNGTGSNAGATGDGKKKKKRIDRNVVVQIRADQVEGHRADIIQDIEKLVQFIENNDQAAGDKTAGSGGGGGAQQRSKTKLQKNVSKSHEDDKTKKRTRSKVWRVLFVFCSSFCSFPFFSSFVFNILSLSLIFPFVFLFF